MHSVKIRVGRYHLRLKPDTKLKTNLVYFIYQIFQSACDLVCVNFPVTERTVIAVSHTKPAIIHNQHFNAAGFCFSGDREQFICVEIKISSFPVVDQDWSFFMKIFASDQVISVEIMIASGHFSQTFMRISHNNFRCLELFSCFQDPAKFFFVDTHNCTYRIKLV